MLAKDDYTTYKHLKAIMGKEYSESHAQVQASGLQQAGHSDLLAFQN